MMIRLFAERLLRPFLTSTISVSSGPTLHSTSIDDFVARLYLRSGILDLGAFG